MLPLYVPSFRRQRPPPLPFLWSLRSVSSLLYTLHTVQSICTYYVFCMYLTHAPRIDVRGRTDELLKDYLFITSVVLTVDYCTLPSVPTYRPDKKEIERKKRTCPPVSSCSHTFILFGQHTTHHTPHTTHHTPHTDLARITSKEKSDS